MFCTLHYYFCTLNNLNWHHTDTNLMLRIIVSQCNLTEWSVTQHQWLKAPHLGQLYKGFEASCHPTLCHKFLHWWDGDIFHWILYYCVNSRVNCECNLADLGFFCSLFITGVYFKRLRLTLETELELELHVIRQKKRLSQVQDLLKQKLGIRIFYKISKYSLIKRLDFSKND